jgi:hypothetical protein
MAAVGTGAAMGLILGHLHGNLRQLDDLMPARLRIVGTGRWRQIILTDFADLW